MALPKVVYVYEDKDSDGSNYLVASTDVGERGQGLVGIYDLREILEVKHQTMLRRPKTKMWFNKAELVD